MNPIICEAIQKKEILKFQYGGKERVVEPHIYGWNAESKREILSGYQIAGESDSSNLPAWRTFYAARIRDLTLIGFPFRKARRSFNPEDPAVTIVYCAAEEDG